MSRKIIAIDFETVSTKSLKDSGTVSYLSDIATHPTLISICEFTPEEFEGLDDYEELLTSRTKVIEIYDGSLPYFLKEKDYDLLAHNREFELNTKFNGVKLKDLLPSDCKVYDTMIMAERLALPSSLDHLSGLFGIHKKDTRLLNKFSKGISLEQFLELRNHPDYPKFLDYCKYDTISTVNIFLNLIKKYPEILEESFEDKVLEVSDKINEYGIPIDLTEVYKAQKLLKENEIKVKEECFKKYGFHPTQVSKIKEYLQNKLHITLDSTDRENLLALLDRDDLDESSRELVNIRLSVSSSSTKKLNKMIHSCVDGRVHGAFRYYKARTGRWSATLIQPQNMPRGKQDQEFFDNLPTREALSELEVKNNLRGFIKAPEGHTFIIADYRQIEFRLLCYIAKDEENMLKIKQGVDLYKELAGSIYDTDEVTKDQRQLGKIVTLGAGYGLGSVGLERILKTYKVDGVDTKLAIAKFRKKYSPIAALWEQFDTDAKNGTGIFNKLPDRLEMKLPSGRKLYYHDPKRVIEDMGAWIKDSYKFNNGEVEEFFYGGKFVENFIQGTARDLLATALVRLDCMGLKPILHVHDEIVIETPIKDIEKNKKILKLCMVKPPEWFEREYSFLLDTEMSEQRRYSK